MPAQRLLTNSETADFLLRHPLDAEYIAKTKLAIESGLYDWTQKLPDWFFGMIPPWGMQEQDSNYGTVTIFFGQDGTLYLSGWSTPLADINKPRYTPPPFTCANGQPATLGICPEDFNILYLVGGAVLVYIGYRTFFAKKTA